LNKSDFNPETVRNHFRGALIGTMIGDALGLPVEGLLSHQIAQAKYGFITEMIESRLGKGYYSDDTQMTIGLAEALLESSLELNLDVIAQKFGENFSMSRGYAQGAFNILQSISRGNSWSDAVARYGFSDGSYGNGSAMRVAPVALAFFGDEEAVKNAAAKQSHVSGHHHPDGVFGAKLQALAVHRALCCGINSANFESEAFISDVIRIAPVSYAQRLNWIIDNHDNENNLSELEKNVGSGIFATEATCAALWFFLYSLKLESSRIENHPILLAINHAIDADTVGAMTGAIAGAFYGMEIFPSTWLEDLENDEKGRDYIIDLADQLVDAWFDKLQ